MISQAVKSGLPYWYVYGVSGLQSCWICNLLELIAAHPGSSTDWLAYEIVRISLAGVVTICI